MRRAPSVAQDGAHACAVRAALAFSVARAFSVPGNVGPACFAPPRAALSRGRDAARRRLKEVVYTLSNHNQNVMSGLWKDLPYKITKKVKENWLDNLFFLVPLVGTYQCVPVPPPPRATPRARRPPACTVALANSGAVLPPNRLLGQALRSTVAAQDRNVGRCLQPRSAPLLRLAATRPARRVETLGLLGHAGSGPLTPVPLQVRG